MKEKPIIFLGAVATKACGGPLTDEFLPAVLNGQIADTQVEDREELIYLTNEFLTECFNVPTNKRPVKKENCPSLPLLLSMLRRSVEMSQPIGKWQGKPLLKAKRAIEYSIFAVIEAALQHIPYNKRFHEDLLEPLYKRNTEPSVVSLNYDVIVDNAMFSLSERFQYSRPPAYHVDISTPRYKAFCDNGVFGHLFKIHGSLNWLYCDKCKRLDLFVSRGMRTAKALDEL